MVGMKWSASTFILKRNDLYGFANIVNGKDGKTADLLQVKLKLGANIDLTGKVWEPIGAAQKDIVELTYVGKQIPHQHWK